MHGEPAQLYWRRRKVRLRPLVLILGHLRVHGRLLAQPAAVRALGETLRRAGRGLLLRHPADPGDRGEECRRPDEALERAARAAFDWDGGTRIGTAWNAFVRGWGRRGLCRGGIVVICSAGSTGANPEVLSTAMERLSRLCHRLVWLNRTRATTRAFRPSTLGMMVAAPHVDLLLSGHEPGQPGESSPRCCPASASRMGGRRPRQGLAHQAAPKGSFHGYPARPGRGIWCLTRSVRVRSVS